MGEEALSIGANTFQFFTRNPRGSRAKPLDEKDAAALLALAQEHQFAPLLAHAPYTMNACSANPPTREFAQMVIVEDLARLEYLPNNLYTFHPGSHGGQGVEAGLDFIVQLLNLALRPELTTLVLLETMSGKGSEVGGSFEAISRILRRVDLTEKVGVCLDTCHVYAAGYDIVNDLDGVLGQFDKIIGLDKLKAIHLNDSLTPYASHKDRHANIGQGTIGLAAITQIINHPRLRHLPFYLETPSEVPVYGAEIKLLREAFRG